MNEHAFQILLAASFTFGCPAIRQWREHARDLTPVLAATTAWLILFAAAMLVAQDGVVGSPAGKSNATPLPSAAKGRKPGWRPGYDPDPGQSLQRRAGLENAWDR